MPLVMRMDLSSKQGAIWVGAECEPGVPIAKLSSPASLAGKNFAPGEWASEDYFVEIAPNVDMTLVAAILVAYDEMDAAQMRKKKEAPSTTFQDSPCGRGARAVREKKAAVEGSIIDLQRFP